MNALAWAYLTCALVVLVAHAVDAPRSRTSTTASIACGVLAVVLAVWVVAT